MTATLPPRTTLAPPPVLPAVVHVGCLSRVASRFTVHATLDCPLVRSAFPSTPAEIRPHTTDWCDDCWPDQQHCRCGAPSGDCVECGDCSADTIRVDTAFRIAS